MAGIRGKERVSTRGGLTSGVGGGKKTVIPATAVSGGESNHSNNESREGRRGHSTGGKKNREGPNNRKSEEAEKGGQYDESRIPRKWGLPAKG